MVRMQPVDIALSDSRGRAEKANDARLTRFRGGLYGWNSAHNGDIQRGAHMGEGDGARGVAGDCHKAWPVPFDKAPK
jgi:hypothetical protein